MVGQSLIDGQYRVGTDYLDQALSGLKFQNLLRYLAETVSCRL